MTTPPRQPNSSKRFLSVWFQCCHSYGRLYRNQANTHFVGRCPKCGGRVSARIGDHGSSRTIFGAS